MPAGSKTGDHRCYCCDPSSEEVRRRTVELPYQVNGAVWLGQKSGVSRWPPVPRCERHSNPGSQFIRNLGKFFPSHVQGMFTRPAVGSVLRSTSLTELFRVQP